NVKVEDLGRAKRVTVDKDNTTIIEGAGKSSDISGRISTIKKQIEDSDSDYDKEKLQERLAKLSGGVAVINVGAATESEMKEKKDNIGYNAEKDKYEDLIAAGVIDPAKVTRTALQNASSISSLLLTTESLITDIPEEKQAMPAMPGGGGMGGMGGGMY